MGPEICCVVKYSVINGVWGVIVEIKEDHHHQALLTFPLGLAFLNTLKINKHKKASE